MINKKEETKENETIRLTIQIGMVASCLVVISGNYESLDQGFQLLTKFLALVLGLLSTSYIMLTWRKYGFKYKEDIIIRHWFYDSSITFYWYIFFMMGYLFLSSLITVLFGISPTCLYIITTIISIIAIVIFYIARKRLDD